MHVHSTVSDGTDTPAELVRAAGRAGLAAVALTDHDTTAGWAPALAALPPGLVLVPGMEISCVDTDGIALHLLAYLVDPLDAALAAALHTLRDSRRERGRAMVELLRRDHPAITWERVAGLTDSGDEGGTVGRPHLARVMVQDGLVPDIAAAMGSRWLGHGGPYHLPKRDLPAETAVALVRGAGGVPVLAHGRAGRRGRLVSDASVAALVAAGMLGIERDHPDHDAAQRSDVQALADRHGLLVTGSSDYHGANKRQPIGAETVTMDVVDQLARLATGSQPLQAA